MKISPTYQYLTNFQQFAEQNNGPARIFKLDGRTGIQAQSIKTIFSFPAHTLNGKSGSVTLWVLSLEDLDSMTHLSNFSMNNSHFLYYPLLSDCPTVNDFDNSNFSFCWSSHWYPQLFAKFYKGRLQPDGYFPILRATVGAGHFRIRKYRWYQFCLTWDRTESRLCIYVNGILIAHSDTVHHSLAFEQAGDTIYAGNPTLALSELSFYQQELSGEQINELFHQEATKIYPDIQEELKKIYIGTDIDTFCFVPQYQKGWRLVSDHSLKKQEDLDYFYVQGKPDAARLTSEGILIETSQHLLTTAGAGAPDQDACYLWTKQFFEGNLYIEYEFKSLQRDGLSLLMVQASGMQREDFMEDYPLRTNGAMSMVCWEDVRNYHWEYYRYVPDVRNDVASHAMIKNPWLKPMGYHCQQTPMEIGVWHKLQFLQIEEHLVCAIDGNIVLDVYDNPFDNNGPVLNCGRIAIRCMIRTRLLIRNFKVYNQSQIPKAVIDKL